jgi:hypothetical protein
MDTIPEDPMLRRIFLDSQIVYVSYSTRMNIQKHLMLKD